MISITDYITNALSADYRRVLSNWRALIYVRRASATYQQNERRWTNTPDSIEDMVSIFARMQNSGVIESIERAPGCYAVMAPFARRFPLREQELLLELNPYAVFTHYTALVHHGFTQNRPNILTAWPGKRPSIIPLGTTAEEWDGIELPLLRKPSRVLTQKTTWFQRFGDFSFGVIEDREGPIPIRITDPERTLIDSLQWPDYAGGISNALKAWSLSQGFTNLDLIVRYTEKYGIKILKQRVGFVAETVGFVHPAFDDWAASSMRGGSSKLVGNDPFASTYSERWNLSINAPVEAFLAS